MDVKRHGYFHKVTKFDKNNTISVYLVSINVEHINFKKSIINFFKKNIEINIILYYYINRKLEGDYLKNDKNSNSR